MIGDRDRGRIDHARTIGRETGVENLRVREVTRLNTPSEVKTLFDQSEKSIKTVTLARESIRATLNSEPFGKLVVVVGPCSINDPDAAIEYATWLKGRREQYGERLELVMRSYFEKPRTTVGWKGLINDPHLDGSNDINYGLLLARKIACEITDLEVPIGTELLDTIIPQYLAGVMSWGAVGARTTESQLHRELASGLSFPVGFKNGTDGNVKIAVDAVTAASSSHRFLGTTEDGETAIVSTIGNPDCHIILRGGSSDTNYDADNIAKATQELRNVGHRPLVMVDCSHGNSRKDYHKQMDVVRDIAAQIEAGSRSIMGVMIESNLKEGSQPFKPGSSHEYGKSITDACVGLDETSQMLALLYQARGNMDRSVA